MTTPTEPDPPTNAADMTHLCDLTEVDLFGLELPEGGAYVEADTQDPGDTLIGGDR